MVFVPEQNEFSLQEESLYKSLCSKGKCLDDEVVAFSKNFKK
jgi:hypothetical protein